MTKRIIFAIALLLLAVGTASAQVNVSYGLENMIKIVNDNPQYLSFINESEYKSVKLSIDEKDYYFVYENTSIKIVNSSKENFKIKINYGDFEKLMKTKNTREYAKYMLSKIPFGVKLNIFFQCLRTDWCRKKIL